ncbi:MAG: hypothetical protein CMM01_20450 [Rhodopirellula sp.]|nr:hypothetical protein [Rhodopirellula sp.]
MDSNAPPDSRQQQFQSSTQQLRVGFIIGLCLVCIWALWDSQPHPRACYFMHQTTGRRAKRHLAGLKLKQEHSRPKPEAERTVCSLSDHWNDSLNHHAVASHVTRCAEKSATMKSATMKSATMKSATMKSATMRSCQFLTHKMQRYCKASA